MDTGIFLPFFLLCVPIVLAIVDAMGLASSHSAMSGGPGVGGDPFNPRRPLYKSGIPRV